MTSRLPRAASAVFPARLPPAGLPGMDAAFSRLVRVPESDLSDIHRRESGAPAAVERTWHVLDNAHRLDELGVTPVGTILCVHGNPTWSFLWRSLLTQATDAAAMGADPWRVIAVDQLEMGFSERAGEPRPLARRIRDLADFTDAIGLPGPVVSFGHDWGGVVSLGWAIDHPELLAGILLLNTAVHQPEDAAVPVALRLALGRGVLGLGTVTTPAFLETTLALAHPPLDRPVKEGYRTPYREATRRGGIGGFVADIPIDPSHESTPELDRVANGIRSLDVPTLLMWGPRDPVFGDRYLDDLLERMQHADVHRFEGAGHLVAEDVDFASSALGWLGERHVAEKREPGTRDAAGDLADAAQRPSGSTRSLWHYLDELRESQDTALIDMAPSSGAAPRTVSWRLLSQRARQIASGLDRIGVRTGDRVSLLIPPGADLTAVLYACLRIGAVVVVADAGLGLPGLTRAVRGAQSEYVIGAAKGLAAARALGWPGRRISTARFPRPVARALGVTHSLADLIELGSDECLPHPPAPADTAAVLFTSGSTGPAKGVVYTHGQLSAVRDALAGHYGIVVGTGLVAGFAPFALLGPALGTRSVTPDMDVTSPKTLTAVAVAAAVGAAVGGSGEGIVVFLSPAAIANVVATEAALDQGNRDSLDSVRIFLSAGAPVPEPLLAAAARLMPNAAAHTPYGMTEGLLLTDITLEGIRDAMRSSPGRGVCVGAPTATTSIRISALDENGVATGAPSEGPNVTGEIVVSAPHLKDHYDRLWFTDRESRRDTLPGRRWHRTGDVGHLDAKGRLWVEGRLPHVITTANGVVTPVGPEQSIEAVEAVARAAVVGVGPRGAQQLVAVVETMPTASGVSLADAGLSAAVRRALGAQVAAVLVVPRLPTDIRHNSKIDRTRLAAWADGVLRGGRMTRP